MKWNSHNDGGHSVGDASKATSEPDGSRPLGCYSVSPIGYGAMQLAGPNVFGPPADRSEAIALLREAVELGVDHIDTSEFYGPTVVNELIREALHPYPRDLVLVSKVGAARGPRGEIFAADRPDELRLGIEENLKSLGVDTVPIVNLRIMRDSGPDAFFDDQLATMAAARDDGLIGAVGLSNVSAAHLHHALEYVDVACVQNVFNPVDRGSDGVLEVCRRRGIAFVPFASLGFGSSSVLENPTVTQLADRLSCTPAQVCLAWELAVAPNLLLIPGTASRQHLRENIAASQIVLDVEALNAIAEMRFVR
jgi:pyridoxine 4-dehydrogenase